MQVLYDHEGNHQGSGCALNKTQAIWSTLGECVERYAGALVDPQRIIRDSYNALEEAAVDPRGFILFSDDQYESKGFPFHRFDPTIPMDWIDGVVARTGEPALLPAQNVYLNYRVQYHQEILDKGYSTGLAAGATLVDAQCGALREVIERDCFSCYWLSGFTPPIIERETLPDTLSPELRSLMSLSTVQYNIRDISTELGIPCVLSLVRAGDSYGVSLGSSCHNNSALALEKALVESFHTFNWSLDFRRNGVDVEHKEDLQDFAQHVQYYLRSERFGELKSLFAEAPSSPLSFEVPLELKERKAQMDLDKMVDTLAKQGHETYLVDLTSPDVKELGFRVVRAVVPGLQPLSAGHRMQHLDRRRLEAFAQGLGRELPQQLNTNPHPFP